MSALDPKQLSMFRWGMEQRRDRFAAALDTGTLGEVGAQGLGQPSPACPTPGAPSWRLCLHAHASGGKWRRYAAATLAAPMLGVASSLTLESEHRTCPEAHVTCTLLIFFVPETYDLVLFGRAASSPTSRE
jgi:hypothetical protein